MPIKAKVGILSLPYIRYTKQTNSMKQKRQSLLQVRIIYVCIMVFLFMLSIYIFMQPASVTPIFAVVIFLGSLVLLFASYLKLNTELHYSHRIQKEFILQSEEKEKRAAELVIANKELIFQNEEKEKRAAEFIIANKELIFQNEEKEERATELDVANIELIFQNDEKEKRATELGIANIELIFQNDEKEKRAAELVIANKELAFQNKEKEKRAAELIIANYARSLIEASLDPLVTISAAGKILDVNEASVKVTGVAREKLIDTDFSDYFTEPKKAQEGYLQVFEKGFVADYPLTIKHKNGNLTDVLYNASVYKDDKGNVLGVFAAARDVTLQKQIQDELLKTQERLNVGLKIANIALSEISYITNTIQLSPESAAMYGFPKNQLEATRQQMHDTFHPTIKAELEAQIIIAMNLDNGNTMALEHAIVLPSGEVRWLKVNKQFFYDHSTQPAKLVYSILVSQDITERKESSQYARSLIEASLDPLVTISADGKITDVNEASIKVTGVERKKLIGTDFSNYFTEPKKAQEGYLQVFEKGFVADYSLTIKHKNGNLTDVLYNASVYKDGNGNVLGVFAAARDVTEQKLAKDLRIANKELAFQNEEKEKRAAELVIINKELQLYAHISSHDLQEPLRKIQMATSRIVDDDYDYDKLSDKGKGHLKRIEEAAAQMQTLVEDLIEYARTNNDNRHFENTNLDTIVREVVEEMKERIEEKHAIIEINELCYADIIPFQFRQLMHNIIGNALKFSKPNIPAHIVIKSNIGKGSKLNNAKLSPEETYCHISVTDNGIGFEEQYSEKIFEIFQHLNDRGKYKGSGMGLAIAKKVVENHKGIITATSKIDQGATFDIYLPTYPKQ